MNQDPFFRAPAIDSTPSGFRTQARNALRGKWGMAILAGILFSLISSFVSDGSVVNNLSPDESVTITRDLLNEIADAWRAGGLGGVFEIHPEYQVALVGTLVSGIVAVCLELFVSAPLRVGYYKFHLDLVDGAPANIGTLFFGFSRCYGKSVLVNLLYSLVRFACVIPMLAGVFGSLALLLFVPDMALEYAYAAAGGIIVLSMAVSLVLSVVFSYRYYFCYLVLAESPETGATDVLRETAGMMRGEKMNLFLLQLSFIGWYLLGVLTCGLGFLAVNPYRMTAEAAFYRFVSGRIPVSGTRYGEEEPEI